MPRKDIIAEVLDRKAVAVLRVKDNNKLRKVIEAIADGGVTVIEVTMSVPNAIEMIEFCSREIKRDIILGVGSVLNAETAKAAINAGAKYVVSPIYKQEIIDCAHKYDVPAMPGCFTPTEIITAQEAGADVVKVFPADVLGMDFFKAILAPMPHLRIMPTGGVTLTNAGDWIKAGACAVGLGSALLDKKAVENEEYFKLTENAITIMNSINKQCKG